MPGDEPSPPPAPDDHPSLRVEEGEAIDPDGNDDGSGSGGEPNGGTATDPAPVDPDPSPVMAWCDKHNVEIRLARVYLRKTYPDEFKELLRDWKDLQELRGSKADKAVAYLDAWLHLATERE